MEAKEEVKDEDDEILNPLDMDVEEMRISWYAYRFWSEGADK
jgi:hypothetical protein